MIEDLVFSTLEELVDFLENVENLEKLPPYESGDEDNVLLSDCIFCGLGAEEEEEEEPSDSNKEDEEKRRRHERPGFGLDVSGPSFTSRCFTQYAKASQKNPNEV